MEKQSHCNSDEIMSQEALFVQTMKNVYAVFGEHSGRLYSTGTEDRPSIDGKWEAKFSISAFDIQASALIGHSPMRVASSCRTSS